MGNGTGPSVVVRNTDVPEFVAPGERIEKEFVDEMTNSSSWHS